MNYFDLFLIKYDQIVYLCFEILVVLFEEFCALLL